MDSSVKNFSLLTGSGWAKATWQQTKEISKVENNSFINLNFKKSKKKS